MSTRVSFCAFFTAFVILMASKTESMFRKQLFSIASSISHLQSSNYFNSEYSGQSLLLNMNFNWSRSIFIYLKLSFYSFHTMKTTFTDKPMS